MNLETIIVTAFITSVALELTRGFLKKFFEKGSIMNSVGCDDKQKICQKERDKEFKNFSERLGLVEKVLTKNTLASKIQAMALIQLCKITRDGNGNLSENAKELDDFIKGRGDFKE